MVAILVIFTILAFLTIDYWVQRAEVDPVPLPVLPTGLGAGGLVRMDPIRIPGGRFLSPAHTWVALEKSGEVRVGADSLPTAVLGGVHHAELPRVGDRLRAGDPIVAMECGDRDLRLRSPVGGTVVEVNPWIVENHARLAEDPYDSSWICRVKPHGLAESLRGMFVADDAVAWMRRELGRLRELVVGGGSPGVPALTLPDGGLPADGLAHHLEPAEWSVIADQFFGGDVSA